MQRNTFLSKHQRRQKKEIAKQLAAGFISLGNAAVTAAIFGQFLTRQNFNFIYFLIGIVLVVFCYFFAIVLLLALRE